MFVALRLITLPADRLDSRPALMAALREAVAQLPGVVSCSIEPVIDGPVINAGHIVWRMEHTTEAQAVAVELDPTWRQRIAPALGDAVVATVGYRVTRADVRPAGAGIWRALLFRVVPEGFPDAARELENQTLLLPRHISTIRSWALSPVAFVRGPKAFTHVWEQEYKDLSGLTGEYMTHPVHWGLVDSWFDAECPNYIVDPHLTQVVCEIDRTIMSPPHRYQETSA